MKSHSSVDVGRLLTMVEESSHPWSDSDLRAMMRHQLEAPVVVDLQTPSDVEWGRSRRATLSNPAIGSMLDLLRHPKPSLELLTLVKDFAKASRNEAGDLLPADIATVLYYTCIMLARVRCDRRITQLDDQSLITGLDWVIGLVWIDEELRATVRSGRDFIAGHPQPN